MRLEPLYRATFTTPESWGVDIEGAQGTESLHFLIADGRVSGALAGRLRGANYARGLIDGTLLPDFRGVLETDDGATVLFSWHGHTQPATNGVRRLTGSIAHVSDDARYRRLNNVVCVLAGEVRARADGPGAEVALDVAELVWEPTTA
jgi:hypothetical protein